MLSQDNHIFYWIENMVKTLILLFFSLSSLKCFLRQIMTANSHYSQNTKTVPLPLLYYVVIYCTLFCFSVARSDLSANIATFVFEMICFNKGSVFQWQNVRNIYFIAFNRYLVRKNTTKYSKSQQTTEAEAGHFLYFDCNCHSLLIRP